jgi:hypothetical protein
MDESTCINIFCYYDGVNHNRDDNIFVFTIDDSIRCLNHILEDSIMTGMSLKSQIYDISQIYLEED